MKRGWYLKQGGWCEVEEGHGGGQTLSPEQPVERPPLALSGMGLHLDVTFSENINRKLQVKQPVQDFFATHSYY